MSPLGAPPMAPALPPQRPAWRAADVIAVAAVLAIAGALVWPELFRGWYPFDDGAMAQVADRVRHGQLPHRDFDDPWTGGWSFLQAAIFSAFGTTLRMLRVPIFVAWLAGLGVGYRVARRFVEPIAAAAVMIASAVWSLYAWHYPLLNWYYPPLAMGAVWCTIRFVESGHRGFVVGAGVLAGAAIVMKVTGFYLLAALLLWTAAHAAEPSGTGRRSAGFAGFVAMSGGAFTLVVVKLVTSLPRDLHGSVLAIFAAPIAATVLWMVWRAWESGWSLRDGVRRVLAVAIPLVVGVALVALPFVLYYALHGALHDLYTGVFVRPAQRLTKLFGAPPGRITIAGMLVAPFVLVVGLRAARAASFMRDSVIAAALGVVCGAIALKDEFTASSAALLVRGLPVMLPAAALALHALSRWRRDGDADAGTRAPSGGDAASAPYASVAMLLVAMATCSQLLQVPWASLNYALYGVPLALLAVTALMHRANRAAVPAVLFGMLFLAVAGYGHRATNELKPLAERWAPQALPRGGLMVSPDDSALFHDVAALVAPHPGPIHVVGDAPEYAFLLERPAPSRVIYDVLADSTAREPSIVLPALEREGVRTVLLLNQFGYNDSLTVREQRALRRAYPESRGVGRWELEGKTLRRFLEVRWRADSAR